MLDKIVLLIISLMVGGSLGVLLMACMVVSGRCSEAERKQEAAEIQDAAFSTCDGNCLTTGHFCGNKNCPRLPERKHGL